MASEVERARAIRARPRDFAIRAHRRGAACFEGVRVVATQWCEGACIQRPPAQLRPAIPGGAPIGGLLANGHPWPARRPTTRAGAVCTHPRGQRRWWRSCCRLCCRQLAADARNNSVPGRQRGHPWTGRSCGTSGTIALGSHDVCRPGRSGCRQLSECRCVSSADHDGAGVATAVRRTGPATAGRPPCSGNCVQPLDAAIRLSCLRFRNRGPA